MAATIWPLRFWCRKRAPKWAPHRTGISQPDAQNFAGADAPVQPKKPRRAGPDFEPGKLPHSNTENVILVPVLGPQCGPRNGTRNRTLNVKNSTPCPALFAPPMASPDRLSAPQKGSKKRPLSGPRTWAKIWSPQRLGDTLGPLVFAPAWRAQKEGPPGGPPAGPLRALRGATRQPARASNTSGSLPQAEPSKRPARASRGGPVRRGEPRELPGKTKQYRGNPCAKGHPQQE